MTAQNSTRRDFRSNGVVYHPDPEVGSRGRWFPADDTEGVDGPGTEVAWLSPGFECFGKVDRVGVEHLPSGPAYYMEVTVDRIVPRG